MFYIVVCVAVIGLVTAGAILYAFGALSEGKRRSETVADGSIYIAILAVAIVIVVAITSPALLMLQPLRLRQVLNAEKAAKTPRQRFRGMIGIFLLIMGRFLIFLDSHISQNVQPAVCDGLLYTGDYLCEHVLGDLPVDRPCSRPVGVPHSNRYEAYFSVLVPSLTEISAHRFLIGYVYGRTRSQTGGLLQIWLLKRFASLLAIQPILLGLIFFSRRLWAEGGALVGAGGLTILFVEVYTRLKERRLSRGVPSPVSQHAVESFRKAARPERLALMEEESTSVVSSGRAARTRGSFASVLEMMSTTLAVVPSRYQEHGPVPLRTSSLLPHLFAPISHRFFFSD